MILLFPKIREGDRESSHCTFLSGRCIKEIDWIIKNMNIWKISEK